MKIDKFAAAVFIGVAIYYLGETIYQMCTTDDLNRIYISCILCILTVALGAIWILHDYCMQLHNKYKDLSRRLEQSVSDVNLKFDLVDENLDRLYINDRYVDKGTNDEILYK